MMRREFLVGCSAALSGAGAGVAQARPFSVGGLRYRDEAEFVSTQRCATPPPSLHVQRHVEEVRKRFRARNRGFAESGLAIWVPVHFHVLHDGDHGRIPESMLDQQVALLNDAYWACGIAFEKASVEYVEQPAWFNMGPGSAEERAAKSALALETDRALNVYTANPADNLLGWATFPWNLAGDPLLDGTVVLFDSLPGGAAAPYNLGVTATHEVGHWLGLFHTFQNGCSAPGDEVEDTPAEAEPAFGCPIGRDTCPGRQGGCGHQLHELLGRRLPEPLHLRADRPRARGCRDLSAEPPGACGAALAARRRDVTGGGPTAALRNRRQRRPDQVRRSPAISRARRPARPPPRSARRPSQLAADRRSPRNSTPKIATSTTLSLSSGATRAASPSLSARK